MVDSEASNRDARGFAVLHAHQSRAGLPPNRDVFNGQNRSSLDVIPIPPQNVGQSSTKLGTPDHLNPSSSSPATSKAELFCSATEPNVVRTDDIASILRSTSLEASDKLVDEESYTPERPSPFDSDFITVVCFANSIAHAVGMDTPGHHSNDQVTKLFTEVYAAVLTLPKVWLDPSGMADSVRSRSLTELLATAAGVDVTLPIAWDEAKQLADNAVSRAFSSLGVSPQDVRLAAGATTSSDGGLEADLEVDSAFVEAGDELWEETDDDAIDPAAFEAEGDPPADDPWIAATLASVNPSAIKLLRPLNERVWKRLMKYGIPRQTRRELRKWAASRQRPGEMKRHTPADGYKMELALQALYERDHGGTGGGAILKGRFVGLVSIDLIAHPGSEWAYVRMALLSFVTGAVGQPDILHKDLRHVYEIKPKAQAVRGAYQLYGRYLLFLNTWETYRTLPGTTPRKALAYAAQVIRSHTSEIGLQTYPSVDLSKIGLARFWTPGPWVPPRRIVMFDGRLADVEVPIRGLLCYQILDRRKPEQAAEAVDVRNLNPLPGNVARLVLALILVEAANQAGGVGEVEALARSAGAALPPTNALRDEFETLGVTAVGAAVAGLVVGIGAWIESVAAPAMNFAGAAARRVIGGNFLVDPNTGLPYAMPRRISEPWDGRPI